jgi:TIR domain
MTDAAQNPDTIRVFYSYAHEDEGLREQLEKHLALLKRQQLIQGWHDREISGGREWRGEIDINLEAAQLILLLISADFLGSDYCYDTEMKRALEKHQLQQARVVPIIIRPVDWNSAPFSHLEALPKDAKPVTTWSNVDEAWTDVAKGIRRIVEELQKRQVAGFESNEIDLRDKSKMTPGIATASEARNPVDIFVSDAGFDTRSRITIIGCIVLETADLLNRRVEKIRDDLLSDPLVRTLPGAESALKRNQFSYFTDDPEVRSRFIDALREILYLAYICFAERDVDKNVCTADDNLYGKLYGRLIFERLRANKSQPNNVWLAKKGVHRLDMIRQITAAQAAEIARRDRVGVVNGPSVSIASVNELCFSVCDYTVGVVHERLTDPNSLRARDFEKIRSKVRVIHNFDTGEFYTRKKPLP